MQSDGLKLHCRLYYLYGQAHMVIDSYIHDYKCRICRHLAIDICYTSHLWWQGPNSNPYTYPYHEKYYSKTTATL